MTNLLSIKNLTKKYHTPKGETQAIKDISLDIKKGEIIGIVGSSGCGKSTLLNILAGLDKQYEGKITSNNLTTSYMLQTDALLPWLNILDNACIGLKIMHLNTDENIKYVKNLIKNFGLENFMEEYPNNLSGGMKQRVALIRTLAIKPNIIFLDEPLSALDYVTRLTITDEIHSILKKMNVTTVLISHDIAECVSFCDRIAILSKRPAVVKNIYEIKLKNKNIPSLNRKDELFNYYYDLVWGDLDK